MSRRQSAARQVARRRTAPRQAWAEAPVVLAWAGRRRPRRGTLSQSQIAAWARHLPHVVHRRNRIVANHCGGSACAVQDDRRVRRVAFRDASLVFRQAVIDVRRLALLAVWAIVDESRITRAHHVGLATELIP